MNDLDKILRKIERVTAPVQEINERLNRVLPPYVQRINEILEPVSRGCRLELIKSSTMPALLT